MLEPVSCLARDGSRALGAGEGTGSKESASCRGLVSQSLKAQDLQLLRVHFLLTTLALFRWESTAVLDKCVFLGPTLIPNRKPWYVRRNFRAYISPSLGKILLPCRRHSTAWSRCYWERWKHARSQCRGKGNDWGQHGYYMIPCPGRLWVRTLSIPTKYVGTWGTWWKETVEVLWGILAQECAR